MSVTYRPIGLALLAAAVVLTLSPSSAEAGRRRCYRQPVCQPARPAAWPMPQVSNAHSHVLNGPGYGSAMSGAFSMGPQGSSSAMSSAFGSSMGSSAFGSSFSSGPNGSSSSFSSSFNMPGMSASFSDSFSMGPNGVSHSGSNSVRVSRPPMMNPGLMPMPPMPWGY